VNAQDHPLLDRVLIAHGGLDRWNSFNTVRATLVTGGSLWAAKGLTQDSAPRQMTVWLHEQRASVTPFGGPDKRTAYSPDRIAIETTDGQVIAERRDTEAHGRHENSSNSSPIALACPPDVDDITAMGVTPSEYHASSRSRTYEAGPKSVQSASQASVIAFWTPSLSPVASATAPVNPLTCTGTRLCVVLLFPS